MLSVNSAEARKSSLSVEEKGDKNGLLSDLARPVVNVTEEIKTMTPIERLDFYEKTVREEARFSILLCESRLLRRELFGNSSVTIKDKGKFTNNKLEERYKARTRGDKVLLEDEIRKRETEIEKQVNELIENSKKVRTKLKL